MKPEQAEGAVVMDVEGSFSNGPKDKAPASAAPSTMSPSLPLFRYAQATQAALGSLGVPPNFDPLHEFQVHLEVEYGGFRRVQMQRIHDFDREKDDTHCTMYTRLVRFCEPNYVPTFQFNLRNLKIMEFAFVFI